MILLEHPSLDPLQIDSDGGDGWSTEVLDIGFPAVREVMSPKPRRDGVDDETAYLGSRAVSVTVSMWPTTSSTAIEKRSQLAAYCHPGIRPTMTFAADGEDARVVGPLRGAGLTGGISTPRLVQVQAQWVASGPILSTTSRLVILTPTSGADGLEFDVDFDMSFPAHVGGPYLAMNLGTAAADFQAAIFGPCLSPQLHNRTTGEVLSFPGLEIADGSYLWIDTADTSVTVEREPSASRYSFLDFEASTWWRLPPGASMVEFTAASSSPPASAWVQWRDAWIM